MRHRLARPAALAAAGLLLTASAAVADTIGGDADTVSPGIQTTVALGTYGPGATVTTTVPFVLTCKGLAHLDAGASVALTAGSVSAPLDGSIVADDGRVGPLTNDTPWPADGDGCLADGQTLGGSVPSAVTIVTPTTDGDYTYSVMYDRTVSNGDDAAVSGLTIVSFDLTVRSNTPPVLALPGDLSVEGNEPGGASVTYAASATDAEDATAPTPSCSPRSGSHFGLGATTVACSVVDSGGLSATGSFVVTVVDTTAPALSGVSGGIAVGTGDSGGAGVTWPAPSATDVVDPAPLVGCAPASGTVFPVGVTTVTCTARDASGNVSAASFAVTVQLVSAAFDEPVGTNAAIDVNGSRSVPVKAQVWVDGSAWTSGATSLLVAACDGGAAARSVALVWSSGRWVGKLDTTGLAAGCWRATVSAGGLAGAGFTLHVSGDGATPAKASKG